MPFDAALGNTRVKRSGWWKVDLLVGYVTWRRACECECECECVSFKGRHEVDVLQKQIGVASEVRRGETFEMK